MARHWALACSLLVLLSHPAAAEHEVFYRYMVLGYVRDAKGAPRAGVEVEVVREKTGLLYVAETDARGFYIIVVRLGDDSVGERLRVSVGETSATVIARFDPSNHADERGTRLDFVGKKPFERATWFAATLRRFLAQ